MQEFIPQIQINANIIARLDCLLAFAKTAEENKYIRPVIDSSEVIDIKQGRHPVIEQELPLGERYVPNDILLDNERQQIIIITGPNMAGKSALLRQTALIVLLAQIGCFVPAEAARIGLVDKIFTRVGASDNISLGESTFMVEMTEAMFLLVRWYCSMSWAEEPLHTMVSPSHVPSWNICTRTLKAILVRCLLPTITN